jgi:periplasmic divalent cation tolerance protein
LARGYVQVQTTIDSRDGADEIVARVLAERLASCGQVLGPVTSTYRWRGALEVEEEWMCLFKTTAALAPRLRDLIAEVHPYEVPEIVAFDILLASREYGEWIDDETQG